MSSAFDKTWLRRDGARDEWSTGTDGLSGCTVLYIISRIGVFAAHYFENVSFSPSKYWLQIGDAKGKLVKPMTSDEVFQQTVPGVSRNGGTYHVRLSVAHIDDDTILAFLIHSAQTDAGSGEDDVGYTTRNQQLRDAVDFKIKRAG
ncbi:unnamed protein product [Penicillium bialowiezense]